MSNTATAAPPPAEGAPALVPEHYPPLPNVTPVRARRIHWLLALPAALLALVLPKRMGPHLAASSWGSAYLVHFSGIIICIGNMWALSWEQQHLGGFRSLLYMPDLTWWEYLLRPLAGFVAFLHEFSVHWEFVFGAVVVLFVIQVTFWGVGVLLIPFYAAGERRWPLYARCVKLLLWSTAGLIPLSYIGWVLICRPDFYRYLIGEETMAFFFLIFAETWAAWVILRLGARYGGPPIGPGWTPRTLRCERCNYDLTMTPLDGRCPECALPVAESLPQRRRLPRFARANHIVDRVPAYFATVWQSLRVRRFAQTLAVHQGHAAARKFAMWNCVAVGVIVLLGMMLDPYRVLPGFEQITLAWEEERSDFEIALWFAMLLAILTLSALALLLLVGLLVSYAGFRDVTARSVAFCYSSTWMLVPAALLALAGGLCHFALQEWRDVLTKPLELPLFGNVERFVVFAGAALLPGLAAILLWLLQIRWLLRETRFANA